jgi:hypothetical protein
VLVLYPYNGKGAGGGPLTGLRDAESSEEPQIDDLVMQFSEQVGEILGYVPVEQELHC